MKRLAIFIGLLGLVAVLWAKGRADPVKRLQGKAMGTQWTLAWRGGDVPPERLQAETARVIEHWEQVASNWRANSDVSRHNRGEAASPDLQRLIDLARRFQTDTNGAFDPCLLEEVHAAGFGPSGKGYDLSSLVEGFAVDRVAERLRELGVRDFAFDLGGEVLAGDGEWPVGIERPDPDSATIVETVVLKNRALSTSGNYRQFTRTEGGLRGHIIDPRTGQPVIRPPCSVTVLAADCATADVWSTALFVLGPERTEPEMNITWHW